MKLTTKLFAVAGLVGAGILVERWRQQRLLARARGDENAAMGALVVVDAEVVDAEIAGIAEVDPEPMTQISGEGIDPDVPVPPGTRWTP
jgi:hypothetical protein